MRVAAMLIFWEARRRFLANTDRSVSDIAGEMGFPSSQYFHTVWRRYRSTTPAKERAWVM